MTDTAAPLADEEFVGPRMPTAGERALLVRLTDVANGLHHKRDAYLGHARRADDTGHRTNAVAYRKAASLLLGAWHDVEAIRDGVRAGEFR